MPASPGTPAHEFAGIDCPCNGAGRGIGRAIAIRLRAKGAGVVVNYHSSADAATQVVREISDNGGPAIALKGDVAARRAG